MSPLITSNYDINIDYLDNQIVKLISESSRYVEQAAKFEKDTEEVKAPKRVEAVIQKVRTIARSMISCLINHEVIHHSKIDNKQG